MTMPRRLAALALAAAALAACGGGGDNPLGNPPDIDNGPDDRRGSLSFVYYQRCVEPVLQAILDVNIGGEVSRNSCAGSGCHDDRSGTGGALRLVRDAEPVSLDEVQSAPDAVRDTAIYRNFYSSQGEAIAGNPGGSRLLNKPLVRGVLHGGGLIFTTEDDSNVRRIRYWINNPMTEAQDEFGDASSMFTPPDPATGSCNE